MPVVTVVMPVYNSQQYLTESLSSVLSQTLVDFELIAIDDYSSDSSLLILESYASNDARVRVIGLDQNSGPAVARNVGIREAKGRYIAFIDSDDIWLPNKLAIQLELMQSTQSAIVFSSYSLIQEGQRGSGAVVCAPAKVTYPMLLKSNYIGCSTAMYDTKKVGKVYMPEIRFRQDYGLWLRILRNGHAALGVSEPLVRYRVRKESVSSNKPRAALYHWKVLRAESNTPLPMALYYFVWYVVLALKKRSN